MQKCALENIHSLQMIVCLTCRSSVQLFLGIITNHFYNVIIHVNYFKMYKTNAVFSHCLVC